DADTYLDGTFKLDAERSKAVITETIAEPLGVGLEEALVRMEQAYFEAVAGSFSHLVDADTTLAAFGGAGPMSAAGAARVADVKRVLIPRTAAVFSALGISFSNVGKTYEVTVPVATTEAAAATHAELVERAERDMFQEGYALADCTVSSELIIEGIDGNIAERRPYIPGDAVDYP